MAATLQVSWYGGASTEPVGTSGETTGFCFNREDSRSGTTGTIPIPTTTGGTNYSYHKYLALDVTATAATSITNRDVARSSAPPAGIIMYWATTSSYTQPAVGNLIANNTTADDVDPDGASTGWTALTTSYAEYDATSVGTSSGRNGNLIKLVIGVSSTGTYTGGPGSAVALPNMLVQYDEA